MLTRTNAPTFASVLMYELPEVRSHESLFSTGCGIRFSIEELPNPRMGVHQKLLLWIDSNEMALIKHGEAVGDSERTLQGMSNNEYCYAESFLQVKDELVDACRDDWIEACGRLIKHQYVRIQ